MTTNVTAKHFSVKSHKFKASNVIISDLEETVNKKPTLRLRYDYPGVGIGPLNIQMDEKLVKLGVTGMEGEKPVPPSSTTDDSVSLSFTDNEQYTLKEKYFISEIEKLEERIKEKLVPIAHDVFDGIDDDLDDSTKKTLINSKANSSIKYSTLKDDKGKKTKKRDHKYTSLRLKMYKNRDESGESYYQGLFTPYGETEPVKMTLNNYDQIIPKWCKVKTILAVRRVWLMEKTGFGITWTPNRVLVTELSEAYVANDFEADTDEELEELEKLDFNDQDSEELDDLVPEVVEPKPKSTRKVSGKKL